MERAVDAPSETQAVLFDLDNTLVDRDAALADALRALAAERPMVLGRDVDAAVKLILAADASGHRDRSAFGAWLAQRFSGLGYDGERLWQMLQILTVARVAPDIAVRDALARVASCYAVAVVSNGGALQRVKLERAGLDQYCQHIVISGEFGQAKPDPTIFAHALELLDCAPDQALFVGDNPRCDIVGAAGAGLCTCWVSRGFHFPRSLPQPDYIIDHVIEITGVLDC